ncbi:autotransporter outer membrane beta-barrel domain-containing protein [Burkholderiaceae bacterium UC74_6]
MATRSTWPARWTPGGGVFNLGSGNDNFIVHDNTVVNGTVDGGSGIDSRVYDINGTANLGALVNFEALVKKGTGQLNVNGPAATTGLQLVDVQAGTLNVTAGASITGVQSTTVASGATLKVDGTYTGSAGNDTMTVSGTVSGTGTIDLGNGDDTLTLNDGASLTGSPISGGGHVAGDRVVLNNAAAMTLDSAQVSNFELLTKTNTGVATLTGTQAYSGGTDIQGGTLNVSGTLNTPTVAMAGATLQVGGTVNGGAGVATVITGSGGTPNTVSVLAGATLLANTGAGDLGSGGNTLDVAGTLNTGGGTFNLGAGNDTFTLHDGATVLGTVDGGAGTNTLNTDINTSANLGASVNFQSLSKTGTGTLNVTGPQGSIFSTVNVQAGTLNVAAAGSLTGVQSTTVASGATLKVDGSYTGSAGNDTLTIAGTVSGAGTIGLGAGDDTLTLRDGAVLANTNPIDGGAHSVGGGDTVVLNNAQALTLDGTKLTNFENLTKQGSGVATLTGSNSFAGTTIVQAGTLRAGGTNVLSAVGAHVVASGATLDLAGFSQTVGSLTNSGTVSLVGTKSGTTLTVTGNYHGNNGVLRLGVDQSNAASPADQLVLSGPTATATGKTLIDVVNVGVLGTATQGDGIELIAARNGATTTAQTTKDAFALVGGHVDGGAFQYRLYAADASGNGESWYLRSDAPNNPGKPAFRPEVSLFAGAPEQMRQGSLVMLSNLHQRSGDVQGGAKSTEELAGGGRRMWGRAIGSDIQLRQAGDVGQVSDGSINGMQLGLDLYADASWHAGLYAGRLTANAKVNGMAGGEWTQVGSSKMRGRYLGGYATWIGSEGIYVDTVLQLGHHGYTLSPKDNPQVSGKGKNLLASVEAGQAFRLNGQWDLEPQLQLTYAKLDIDDVEITSGTVQQRSVNGWQARLGLRLKGSFATDNGMLKPYARLNLNVAPNGKDGTRFVGPAAGAAEVSSSRGQQAVEVAGGFTWEASRTVSVYGEVGKLMAVGGDSRVNSGMQASLGLRVNW